MADTALIYNETAKCDDCGNSPIVIQHWGPITNGENKKLCQSCWKKRLDKKEEEDKTRRL